MRRPNVSLTRACNNACVFCAQDGLAPLEAGLAETALRALAGQSPGVTFVGGEPTLVPELPALVRLARSLGFTRVGVQTNGRRLADPALAGALAEAGLTDVHVTVLGADAATHDYHTGVAGSFAELLAGMAASRARGLELVATTVLTRSNFRALNGLPQVLSTRGVRAWRLATAQVAGRAVRAMDPVVPRLALALPYGLHALEMARRLGLEVFVEGAPWCLLGPFAARALPDTPRAFGPACDGCPARDRCPGVDPLYLARFGPDELSALPSAPAAPASAELAERFSALGDAFVPEGVTVPAPPAQARAAIANAGKSVPGAAEAPGRKSGEAMKSLFPHLFKDG